MTPAANRDEEGQSVLLIVEDEELEARTLERLLRGPFLNRVCSTLGEGRQWVPRMAELAGAVIDLNLPDGSGFELVEELRRRSDHLPILVLTGMLDPRKINRAQLLGVSYVVKPDFEDNLGLFLRQVTAVGAPGHIDIEAKLAQVSRKFRLSSRETQILAAAARGIPRARLADVLGTSENTIKSQIRSLLDKTRTSNLSEAVWLIHG